MRFVAAIGLLPPPRPVRSDSIQIRDSSGGVCAEEKNRFDADGLTLPGLSAEVRESTYRRLYYG